MLRGAMMRWGMTQMCPLLKECVCMVMVAGWRLLLAHPAKLSRGFSPKAVHAFL
jgi:hypothetical protein